MRSEMAQIHHEIYELRKLAESCIASQVKMQHSIKEEVCSALREAGKWQYNFFKVVMYLEQPKFKSRICWTL